MDGKPIARALLFAAVVLGGMSAACNSIVGPSSPDSNWRAVERGRFTVYVRPGSSVEQHVDEFVTVLEDQYDHTVEALSLRYAGHISAFVSDSGPGFGSSGTAYPATEAIDATCASPVDANVYVLLAHETNHVIIENGIGRPGTSFLNEGMASATLSERFHRLGRHFLYPWTRREAARIPTLSSLADDSRWSGFDFEVKYNATASFLSYLLETYGPDRVRQLYGVSSSEFEQRFAQIYGRPLAQAETEWRQFCADWVE